MITQVERYKNNLAKAQQSIALTDMVLLQNSSISYKDLLYALEAVFTPGTSSGSGEVLDMGDRMTGNTIVNMGNRM
jgi:hypothetical protein